MQKRDTLFHPVLPALFVAAALTLSPAGAWAKSKRAKAKSAAPLVEVRHAPKLGGVTATVQLAAGETHTFSHEQPFDIPVQGICAQPQQGERKCWFPQDNESDKGGRFIMAPGFVLKK